VLEVAPALPEVARDPVVDVALLGSWTWDANRAGLDWFLERVVPLLEGELKISIGGAGSEQLGRRATGLEGHGLVPDAARFLSRARVVAVPAVAGGGLQVKTLDAVASGAAVVATSLAVRGLSDLPGSVAVADDPAPFADALRRLAADPGPAEHESVSWSRARRERFARDVARWVAESAGRAVAEPEPLVGAHRSEPRPA
jgi:glycosyltransferase involved in cell wall biosynthesis